MRALIMGGGAMGRAIGGALEARGDRVVAVLGRPGRAQRPDPPGVAPVDVGFEFSHASSAMDNVRFACDAGCRAIVVGTTGLHDPEGGPGSLAALAAGAGVRIVLAPSYSIGAVLFGRLAVDAARLFGRFDAYDPYLMEWHRRRKPDRPSGTAVALAERLLPHLPGKRRARLADGAGAPAPDTLEIVALRAGASPGMHLLGFDADGETIELRITARDRSAYVAGALLAADCVLADPPGPAGLVRFETLVDALLRHEPATAHPPTSTDTPEETPHVLVA